ncbi:melanocyte-stimulating hormone receptor-like [Stylophora pistillata]|uniref:melanocyte-stimulating hormone receptor-like n=1 Tax=Stylophora pistillata TaxID=50429 RepID=UPI000C04E420|nr:melanocyte-stimulating hormone receptor-like [Stylophora pistillata]
MENETFVGKQTTAENLYCSLDEALVEDVKQLLIFFAAFNIFLSLVAFLGNAVILDALRKESSIRPPSKLFFRCLATTDICVGALIGPLAAYYWITTANKRLIHCQIVVSILFMTANILTLVSLLTVTAISVDRLLGLSLGQKFKHVVTLKRTYVVAAAFWITAISIAVLPLYNFLLYSWCIYTIITLCLATAIFTYTKIFCTLRHNHNRGVSAMHHMTPLTVARYRKAVSSALWVQATMVVCFSPHVVVGILGQVLPQSKPIASLLFITKACTVTLVYLNSSLNPILYCWKIKSIRNAVKARVKQIFCC